MYQPTSKLLECCVNLYCQVLSFKYFLDDSLLVVKPSLQVLHIELKQVQWRGTRLTEQVREPLVLTNDSIEIHPQGHGVKLTDLMKLIQEYTIIDLWNDPLAVAELLHQWQDALRVRAA